MLGCTLADTQRTPVGSQEGEAGDSHLDREQVSSSLVRVSHAVIQIQSPTLILILNYYLSQFGGVLIGAHDRGFVKL